jgi:hypothetical protein
MSTRVSMAFAAAIITFALPASIAGSGNRNNEHTLKLAQYCVPENDIPGAQRTIYC